MGRESDSRRQLDLFGGPPSPPDRVVGPVAVPDDLVLVATGLPEGIHLGTSSWSFPGWDGLVYDRTANKTQLARHGLAAYARHPLLRTVGIDRTYYGPIPASAFADYAAAVPDHFRFLVKASSESTSPLLREGGGRNELFLDPVYAAQEVVGPFVEGLGAKAGPLVFQFPPVGKTHTSEPEKFAERLGEFLSALPRGPWYAVELRDRQLLVPEYVSALESAHVSHVLNVHPRMPSVTEQWEVAGANPDRPLVVRWMLHSGLGYEEAQRRYEPFSSLVDEDPDARESLANLALRHAARQRIVIIIANNKAEGSAPLTIFKLAQSITKKGTDSLE